MQSLGTNQPTTYYLIKENDGIRILAINHEYDDLGRDVLYRLSQGDLAGARRWLDMVRDELKLEGGEDPYAGPAFPRFWTKGKEGDADMIRAAGSQLVSLDRFGAEAMPTLLALHEKASDADKIKYEIALVHGYSTQYAYAEMKPFVQHLLQESPESLSAFRYAIAACSGLKDWPVCDHAIQDRLQRLPDDVDAIRAMFRVGMAKYDGDMMKKAMSKLDSLGKTDASDLNSYAWGALMRDQLDDDVIKRSQESVVKSGDKNASIAHTLACIYAEVGKPSQAREVLLHAMDISNQNEPNPSFWYVFGRIAEQYGMNDEAMDAYKHVEKPEFEAEIPGSTYELALRRMKVIASPAPAKSN